MARLHREMVQLNSEAELHEQTAQRILALERAKRSTVTRMMPDAKQALTSQVERSALTLVNRGNSLLQEPDSKTQAAESFRRVLELFPQSHGAALARERLNQIGA